MSSIDDLEIRVKSGELKQAIEIPTDFGRDLLRQTRPEVSVWLDGAMRFRAETVRGYALGLATSYMRDNAARQSGRATSPYPIEIETRFPCNQAFKSAQCHYVGCHRTDAGAHSSHHDRAWGRQVEINRIHRQLPVDARHEDRIHSWQAVALCRYRLPEFHSSCADDPFCLCSAGQRFPPDRNVMQLPPSTHFVTLSQAVLHRGAGFAIVWPQMLALVGIGVAFFAMATLRFRKSLLSGQ